MRDVNGLTSLINVTNPAPADYADSFSYMIIVVRNDFIFTDRLKQEVQFYSRRWILAHAIAFNKRWYDTHPLST